MKRLIVCCDGTWQNLESSYPSNVVKLSQGIESSSPDGITQIVFYDEGIGNEGNIWLTQQIEHLLGGGLGKGIDKNIQDSYRFLCLNYCVGDEIYLFGFSRGAYTVRSLAGLIYNSGILTRSNIMKIGEAYKLYRSKVKPNDPQMIEFRQKYCIPHQENDNRPFITLLTCWDTVGALGIPNFNSLPSITKTVNKKYQFHDTKLSKIIQNALHAVAIDEERVAFEVTLMQKSDHLPNQQLWQKWFPGDHGCVGGGSQEHSGLSDGALQWIIDSITDLKLGLAINPALIPTGINPKPESVYNDSDMIGKITKSLGKKVREVSDEIDDFHESVVQRWKLVSNYRPENLKSKHGALLDFYIKACLFAIDNQIDDACDNLQKAIKINKNKFINWLKSDSDLEKIRSDERFQNLSK